MKPAPFAYLRPKTLAEATAALADDHGTSAVIAGGQSFIPMLNLRVASVDLLVDVSRLAETNGSAERNGTLRLGAATTHAMIEERRVPDPSRGLMPLVASGIAYRAIRNFGTIGGSLALADPAADWPVCLIALNADAVIAGPAGERREPVAQLIRGPCTTALARGEIIIALDIPQLPATARWGYAKLARKTGAFATSLAMVVLGGSGGAIVALGGTADRPRALPATGTLLAQEPGIAETALIAVIEKDVHAADPDADDYRRHCHKTMVRRAIAQARAK